MFRNDGGKRFQDVTTAGNFGHLQKGHGIAWGDVDNDGDQDVFEPKGGASQSDRAYGVLYENPHATRSKPKTDWVSLELEGTSANEAAFGARVTLRLQAPNGPQPLHRLVGTGGSFGSSSPRTFVGLSNASAIVGVDVAWPIASAGNALRSVETFRGIAPGRHYRVKRGADADRGAAADADFVAGSAEAARPP